MRKMEKRQPKGFNLYNVSLARNWLYALSILMIVFFHCGLKFSNTVINVIKVNCNFAYKKLEEAFCKIQLAFQTL